jgi:hypothetical protein
MIQNFTQMKIILINEELRFTIRDYILVDKNKEEITQKKVMKGLQYFKTN